ncbi:MarR family winged helix-turn-helix transcriptional regulator [Clavibacter sp. VKM Ac-2872]|uniref:MarR family winged helix-turn-helix transcriptional regulator n=1 Tax=Clavibacter sp. VKM Ac-2872 TaxID=2783812 RepID=UPI00188AD76A|nr:MarR family transcriptional regulator [Clavibacter sp. VKM Ac-2872]MBF4622986.1 MarR family transcriptional regulator [Clavibacter sp. VKM Ac-2872]
MPPDPSDAELRVVARRLGADLGPFRRRLMNASRSAADLPDLPDAQVEVLRRLETTGWATPTGLGRGLGLARSTVSNLILAMERDGLVDRRLAKGDGRSTEVGLTDRARDLLRTFDRSTEGVLVGALRGLTPDELRDIARALPAFEALHAAIGGEPRRTEAADKPHP